MTQVIVTLPDEDKESFFALLEAKGYSHAMAEEDAFEVPEWQKELVRQRIATAKPEDYLPWEQVREELRSKLA